MIDTGASVNLLKENASSPIVWINKKSHKKNKEIGENSITEYKIKRLHT